MMTHLVLLADPLAIGGQIAAIIICVSLLILVLVALALNLALAFGLSWVREKANLIKILRPSVESVNKTSEAAIQGVAPQESENAVVRTAASIPLKIHTVDKKVDEVSERAAHVLIEVRARTVQVKTVMKVLFLPGITKREARSRIDSSGLEFASPGYRILMEEKSTEIPSGDGSGQTVATNKLKNVLTH